MGSGNISLLGTGATTSYTSRKPVHEVREGNETCERLGVEGGQGSLYSNSQTIVCPATSELDQWVYQDINISTRTIVGLGDTILQL